MRNGVTTNPLVLSSPKSKLALPPMSGLTSVTEFLSLDELMKLERFRSFCNFPKLVVLDNVEIGSCNTDRNSRINGMSTNPLSTEPLSLLKKMLT